MTTKQEKTLAAIFESPTPSNISWHDVESLFTALGAEISQGRGSRVRVKLNEIRATFHRPHPKRIAGRGMVRRIQRFLTTAGISVE